MKKTAKTRIAAAAMTLVMLTSLSAVAFADGPQGGPQMGGMQMNQQMGGNGPMGGMQGAPSQGGFGQDQQMGVPQDGFGQDQQMGAPQGGFGQDQQMGAPQGGFDQDQQTGAPQDGFGQDQQMGAPQGGFGQDQQMGAPQGGFDQNEPMNGQQPPEMNGQKMPGGMDPMNQIISAVNSLEDEDVKANIEALMKEHLDAMEAERNAEDDNARADAAEAVAAAQTALDEALTAAGIEITMEAPNGQQPPELPDDENMTPPANGQQPPEKPEGEDIISSVNGQAQNASLSENDQGMFRLFQQFLEWLKGNNAA